MSLVRLTALAIIFASTGFAQRDLAGSAAARKSLDRLATLGSVLMIAAHPDDENTALIAYFARGRNMRTGYLSLTRGEGGQNLIGSEQGDKIGIIRTQELLAARAIDGGEQFFSSKIDFGFSKNAEETIAKWGRESVLADIVWTIRKFQPDVIVLRFSGTPRDGHGHHQTSALLGKDAFAAAADPAKFPEQLKFVQPWQAKRLYFNLFAWNPQMEGENDKVPGTIVMDYGEYDPVLGASYTEIAGVSRSQHRSQGMGSPERKGSSKNHLLLLAGDQAHKDPFDGIDTTWTRLEGGAPIAAALDRARREFRDTDPAASVPTLLEARKLIAPRTDVWSKRKVNELDETIALCLGLWVDASAERPEIVAGSEVKVSLNAINRSKIPVEISNYPLKLEFNRMATHTIDWNVPANQDVTQPYWLGRPKKGATYTIFQPELLGLPENPPVYPLEIRARVMGEEIVLHRAVHHRYVDRVEGEKVRPIAIVPPIAVSLGQPILLFTSPEPKPVEVTITAKIPKAAATLVLQAPAGWKVDPPSRNFSLAEVNEQTTLKFTVAPAGATAPGKLHALAMFQGGAQDRGIDVIQYPHFPPQTLFPPAIAELIPIEVKNLSKRIGYVMGAGDEVPGSLREMGCEVALLTAGDLARADLRQFDAIVTGVRAYNTRPELRANHHRLMDYVAGGGTMVVQYNVADNRFWGGNQTLGNKIGPYPMRIGPARVTDEDAAVELIDPTNALLKFPNTITAKDWDGWIQERGLYFPVEWDAQYQPLFRMRDPGEDPQDGATLVARHGDGVWIYTSLAFFRQLPAGVPGAYRLFANFLSAAKAPRN
jgi:LmbE family N-acetylglucosaminyl deacetylase